MGHLVTAARADAVTTRPSRFTAAQAARSAPLALTSTTLAFSASSSHSPHLLFLGEVSPPSLAFDVALVGLYQQLDFAFGATQVLDPNVQVTLTLLRQAVDPPLRP